MRVMVMVKATANSEAGKMPTPELLDAMTKYNEALVDAGVMVDGEGLHPSSQGKRIQMAPDGRRKVVDGPFAEAKELIAGFWIWNVASMEEAVEWARKCPDPMPGEQGELEIRPVFEAEDFGDVLTPEVRERDARMRAQLDAKR